MSTHLEPVDTSGQLTLSDNATPKKRHGFSSNLEVRYLYRRWKQIRQRTMTSTAHNSRQYFCRGITLCEEWHDPAAFIAWAVENGARRDLELDRIDNDRGYSPENCRFVTRAENSRNRRTNRWIEAFGERKIFKDWIVDSRCRFSSNAVRERLKRGLTPEAAIAGWIPS